MDARYILLVMGLALGCFSGFGQFITLEGRNFMRNGVPFYPIVMNYAIEFMTDVEEPNDTDMVRLSATGGYDMNYVQLECDDQPECDAQLLAHFAKLQSMGFNTVRLTGQRLLLTKDQFGAPVLSYGIRLNDWYEDPYMRSMVGPTFTDPWSMKFINSCKRFLDLATTAGLNVIFAVSPASLKVTEPFYYAIDSQPGRDLVAYFLIRLKQEFHLRPSLMAFDLINEPIWMHSDNHMANLTKQEVCDITTQWYDSIHTGPAPYPLVTLGGYSVAEAGSWDPAIMKLDFYSPHVYPEPSAVTDHNVQSTIDRVNAEIHWLGATCPIPWLIGETAFSADSDFVDPMDIEFGWANHLDADPAHHKWPYMDGSEGEQATFAAATLNATRAALGSGYSWWGFQNDRFGGEGTLPFSVDTSDHGPYLSNFFGVLKYGNEAGDVPWNVATPWRDKFVITNGTFINADQSPVTGNIGQAPPNYFNWHGLSSAVINSGMVYDQNSNPVSHGIVEVDWPAYLSDNPSYEHEDFYDRVPLNTAGYYAIRSAPPSLVSPSLPVSYLQDSGESRVTELHVSGGESIQVPHIQNANLNVALERMHYERVVQGETYGLSEEEELTAWSMITLHDVVAEGNGTTGAELNAWTRDGISVTGETHFQQGSEAHLWLAPTFPDCGSTAYHMMPAPPNSPRIGDQAAKRTDKGKQVELSFELPDIQVLQDPGGTYAVFTSNGGPGSWQVFDGSGKLVWISTTAAERAQCETSYFARGEYTVLWQSRNHRAAKRFIRP